MRAALAISLLATVLTGAPIAYGQDSVARVSQVDSGAFPTVDAYTSVLDPNGDPILGLTAQNFHVFENGREVPFELRGDALGISVVLVLDRSGSMDGSGKLVGAKAAVRAFVTSMKPQDKVALISFANDVTVDQALTSDKTALLSRVDAIQPNGGTGLYNAAAQALDMARPLAGRRAIVLLTDGMDTGSAVSIDRVEQVAKEDKTNIFTFGLGQRGGTFLFIPTPGDIDEGVLKRMATASNGEYFYAPDPNQLTKLYTRIAQQLGSEYVLRYQSPRAVQDGTRREVEVRVTPVGAATMNARNAYVVSGVLGSSGVNWVAFALMFALLAALLHPAGVPALLDGKRKLAFKPGGVKLPKPSISLPKREAAVVTPKVAPPTRVEAQKVPAALEAKQITTTDTRAQPKEVVINQWPFLVGTGPGDNLRISNVRVGSSVAQFEEVGPRLALRVLKPGSPVRVALNGQQAQLRAVDNASALIEGSLIAIDDQLFMVHTKPWRVVRQ